ncbi:Fur family transcriptional regulator [Cellulomonas sp. NPDC058312]|jgi:Fur family ferric uptake transcriptional regulator|uniref:Fur family transcriptional regulator n=1 Tax=Cellulomonas sp. NPDC058312 TaxID=3346441 RepID=UPI0036EB82E9
MAVAQRTTKQRTEILGLLDDLDEFRSAQQLHDVLRGRGSTTGLATVYRAVQTLADAGEVDVLRSPDGEAVYRRCQRRSHHHHLVCRYCGKAVEIDGPGAESWAAQIAATYDFSDVEHTIELLGTCAECRAERAAAAAAAG